MGVLTHRVCTHETMVTRFEARHLSFCYSRLICVKKPATVEGPPTSHYVKKLRNKAVNSCQYALQAITMGISLRPSLSNKMHHYIYQIKMSVPEKVTD